MPQKNLPVTGFEQMNLNPVVFSALKDLGYDTPTPIQSRTIPCLIQGKDVVAQARTGTGKTAAFALPVLSRIDLTNKKPQVLVLTPTRELAIQVAEAFKGYGRNMPGLNVLPVYGGQSYGVQLNQLKRGVHVVVGTPGRLMDHMKKKTVSFSDLFCLILDEADEMLNMGFIEDVEWILDKTPRDRQSALFSATMPGPVQKIARKYLNAPEQVILPQDTPDSGDIHQQYCMIDQRKKTGTLIRILESIHYDGVIVFTKTRAATLEVAEALQAGGFKAEALNGDMAQNAREQTVNRLKKGHIDILAATDVAARGLDVDRISHVVNFDMPSRVAPYIHRIGRTGRAGRTGEAILLLNRNEKWMLKAIEKQTGTKITEMVMPSGADINKKRTATFYNRISRVLAAENADTDVFETLINEYAQQEDVPVAKVAAALAKMGHGDTPFFLKEAPAPQKRSRKAVGKASEKPGRPEKVSPEKPALPGKQGLAKPEEPHPLPPEKGMERYRIEVGTSHGLRPKDIVGAISNEAGLDSRHIGQIKIEPECSFVDLPFGMPGNTFQLLKRTWVRSRRMAISRCA
ncbi:MAG: DEAD/DEAH box helicase [Desulfotignum sp.]|nr:DEAD/DEAH box helicase [Desulfotignum sp.]